MDLIKTHLITYWTTSGSFLLADYIVSKYNKDTQYKYNIIDNRYWKHCYQSLKSSLFNQIFITIPVIYYFKDIRIHNFKNTSYLKEFAKLVFYMFISDIYFFCLHYFFHKNKFLYKNIHKYHHRVRYTSAISALDAHPIEHIFINLGAVLCGPLLLRGYHKMLILWVFISTFNPIKAHSGYKRFSKRHFNHHLYSKYNYGHGINFMDRIFKTLKKD